MLVVGSSDKSAFRSIERVLARGDMELEASVVSTDDGLHTLPILRLGDGDAGARQRATGLRVDDRPGDAVGAGGNERPLRVLGLRMRGAEEQRAGRGEHS